MKKWQINSKVKVQSSPRPELGTKAKFKTEDIINVLLGNRGIRNKRDRTNFFTPPDPYDLTASDVGITRASLGKAVIRIAQAIKRKESVVVYADYDADGITAGAIMWETLHKLGAHVMPYIPHRVEEGYGFSIKGLDTVKAEYHPSLIITVDHGITAYEKVAYAKQLGMEVIVTDHHVKPRRVPRCIVVHTTQLSGAGVSWFVAKEVVKSADESQNAAHDGEILALTAIGTIADMVPLVGSNRSIVKYGLAALNSTKRIGLVALIVEAGLTKGTLGTYDVSHILAPRLNAMGRLVHAMDALRLLCTKQEDKARLLARKLGLTNRERQQLTTETTRHALQGLSKRSESAALKKLLFISHQSYNQGVIGLVAGKIVEEYYKPAVVVSEGEVISKASARSIAGFNIVEAIRSCSDILIDVGGHPMAAGFTVETKHLELLRKRLENIAEQTLDKEKLTRVLRADLELPLTYITYALWQNIRDFEPFGFGNPEPTFVTRKVEVADARLVGAENKHLRLTVRNPDADIALSAIAFGMGEFYSQLRPKAAIDIAYSINVDSWNGNHRLQLKIKDIHGV